MLTKRKDKRPQLLSLREATTDNFSVSAAHHKP